MNADCYFVTGAAGFVGRRLCRRLRAAGHRVRGLVRRDDPDLAALGVEVVRGELANPAGWQDAVGGADYVVHCAAVAAFGGGHDYETTNVAGTRHVLDAARRTGGGLRRFVFVSTIGAIDRAAGDACTAALDERAPACPSSDYGRSKLRAEQLVRESGLPFSIVRPAMVVGGAMRADSHFAVFVRMALRQSPAARFAWPGRFSVVHVDDLAAALELCATHPAAAGGTFFCAGTPVAVRDCFAQARPDAWRLPMAWAAGVARSCPWPVPFSLKAMLLPALTADDARLQALGWRPQRSAAAALQEVIDREHARLDPEADPGGQTVVTGAASGLGRALVDRLAPRRRQLLLVDRDAAGLASAQAAHPHARVAIADLADESAVAALVGGGAWRAHPVREVFACAGIGLRGPVLATDPAQHARLFKVNVLARLALAHAALPGMVRDHFGRVVFISSSSAFQPLPFMASYAASNAALLQLGEAWAAELAGSGVQMLTVCPGGMQTNFQAAAGVRRLEGERLMPPEAVADRIVHALARGRSTAIVSARAQGMALTARVLPRAVSVALWQRLMARLR
jgi:nucleoside-diphosphate-sugar epimerase